MTEKRKKKISYAYLHKVAAATSLVAFLVMILGGMMQGVRTVTILTKSSLVILGIALVSWVLLKIIATYEEMNSGKT